MVSCELLDSVDKADPLSPVTQVSKPPLHGQMHHRLDRVRADPYTEYREAFALLDKRGTGQVPKSSLGELLRSLGQNPTQAEVNDLERQVGQTCMYGSRMGRMAMAMVESYLTG